ncbi:MAG TPA: hypothetical protein VNT50_03160 [Microbacterium sp.]|uniref:hypothetical protein n=1 Tax=Microbacterium sp. TaxID=51671 RepID=UPI002C454BE3|nr:hypothetical protein [Microbacterium sp.]HWI30462.1 hypothetical protein [Microbacterium sp.]
MTAYPAWTPASRPGIIPLHPLSFGTILGRSFAALRQNPKVLLGFALILQTVLYVVLILAIGGIAFASFIRLDTLQPGTEDYDTVFAGSVLITVLSGFVLGLAATALSVLVQAVVVSEVAHAVLAEKLTLGGLWRRVKPVAWRLIGYTMLVTLGVLLLFAVLGGAILALGFAVPAVGIGLTILVVVASIPLSLWLSTKLALVPSVLVLEHGTIRSAVVRSWVLIRGRFWPALGVLVIIGFIMGVIGQVVSVPFSLLSTGITAIIAPTGEPTAGAIAGIIIATALTQIVVLLIQSVAIVVQATAASLIYIDCRMRHEGLDLDLLTYVEQRDAGATSLPDPYSAHAGRTLVRAPYAAPVFAPAYPAQGYPAQGYPAAGYPPAPPASAAPFGPPPPVPPVPPAPQAQPASPMPPAPPTPPTATAWTAPGASGDDSA